jgi:hypothetical protein
VRGGTLTLAALAIALAIPAAAHAQVYDVSNTPGLAEGEETVAVDPRDPNDVVVGSNQWQPATAQNVGNEAIGPSGATTCAVWASHDGGRTWSGGRLESSGFDALTGPLKPPQLIPSEFDGEHPDEGNAISADQNTVFDRHGNAYYACLNFGVAAASPKVFVYRSTDGGRSWGPPMEAFDEASTQIQIDRPFLAIDDSGGPRDGTLYLTFETMFYQAYLPEVYARSSTDGGRTWSPIARVDEDAGRAQWDPRQYPVVGPDGTLYVVYDAAQFVSPAPIDPQATPLKLIVARSSDGGRTFERSDVEPHVSRIQSPDEAFTYFVETISAIAADASHAGRVAVAWPDKRSGAARILLRYSIDSGRTWSGIVDVADDPPGDGNQHDHVALTYLPDGRLVVVWRDRRNGGGAFGGPLDVFARVLGVSPDGALTPGRTVRLTERPQPDGQNTHGSMPTEYLGATSDASGLSVSWNELRGQYLDDVFRRVPLAVFGAPASPARPHARLSARLSTGARCARSRLPATVTGRDIRIVTFALDGRRIRTVRHADRRGRWSADFSVGRLRPGAHRLTATITFRDGGRLTLRRSFRRCASRHARPRFTG